MASVGYTIIPMNSENIDAALVYGMKNRGAGLYTLLGPNWIEGKEGALLNVYSPFMMLASKAAKAQFSRNPTKEDLKKARKRFRRDVAYFSDDKNPITVKFAVSFYGPSETFATQYAARIIGFGRGKQFELKPDKERRDKIADPTSGSITQETLFSAINAYYFKLSKLTSLEQFELRLINTITGKTLSFQLIADRLY
ncbi:MAG: hypothetical protein AAGI66_09880 [Cyanobacteria bacterium P01_H01_bin.74]